VVGSRLIGKDWKGRPRYFQSRPSPTGYDPAATLFGNLGPNSKQLRRQLAGKLASYLKRETRFDPGLTARDVPPDAVQTTASGVDPHISPADAAIQAHRVAKVRGLPLEQVMKVVDEETDGRGLGVLGEPGVNVLELNLALDAGAGR
jgi:K+-transporting ATPase ATPase C chain